MRAPLVRVFALLAPVVLAACSTTGAPGAGDPAYGFSLVSDRSRATLGKDTTWVQTPAQASAASARVKAMINQKTVSADTAVQVALLNNKGLQAAYAEIGLSSADLWQESLLVNPTVSVGIIGVDPVKTIEGAVVNNILAAITRPRRVAVADARFRQAQLRAAEATLNLAAETRRAWIQAAAARERVGYLVQAQAAADAASDLAQKLGETGAFTKTGQAREHVFFAELTGEAAEARLEARTSKEELTRLMGLWGSDINFKVPASLPPLPKLGKGKRAIEGDALRNRVDLEIAQLELEALAKSYGLDQATRFVTDLQLLAGVEIDREKVEREDGSIDTETSATPVLDVEFAIPIFDTGKARMRKAEMQYLQAANLLAERAVNVRSEAREAYDRYRSTYDIARHYRNSVVPLRQKIEDESVLTYNGMITNTFELLADTRAKINSILLSLDAKRNFWLADVTLSTAIHGGGGGGSGGDDEPKVAAAGGDEE